MKLSDFQAKEAFEFDVHFQYSDKNRILQKKWTILKSN